MLAKRSGPVRLALMVAGCTAGWFMAGSQALAQSPKTGGTLTVATETDARGFDAVKGGVLGVSAEIVLRSMQEPLINWNPGKEPTPRLALSWSESADGKVWTFKLRPGVKFHDGNDFTAEDVAHHYNRILDPKNKSRSRTFISVIDKVVMVDKLTVAFHLQHPWQAFLPAVGSTSMSGPIPSKANVVADKQNRHPIGTGPFVFESWQGGDRITVKRNPDYWNKGAVHLDKVVFRVLPDTQTRFASLKSGESDVIWTDRGSSIVAAKKDKDIVVHDAAGAGSEIILFNTRREHLKDPRVRAAIAHARNQEAFIKIVWQNTRPSIKHPLTGHVECGDAKYRAHDPKKAKALIADYGKPVKLTYIHTATPRGREIGQITQQMLKAAGIELDLKPVDQNTLVKLVFTGEFDISGWRIVDAPDIGPQLFALAHSKSSYNLTGYSTPEFDAIASSMRSARDRKTRLELQCKMAEIINDSANIQWGAGNHYHAFSRKNVKGIPTIYRGLVDVTSVWLDK